MAKAKATKPEQEEELQEQDSYGKKRPFEEWRVDIVRDEKGNSTYEKVKKVRDRVLITEEQAETLNNGVITGGNSQAKMYFLPE